MSKSFAEGALMGAQVDARRQPRRHSATAHRLARLRTRQRGWSLVEMSMAVALMGLMSAAIIDLVAHDAAISTAAESGDALQQATDAVQGHAYVHWKFPDPTAAQPLPGEPGYLQGRLPIDSLGLYAFPALTYTALTSMTKAPEQVAWKADPRNWLGSAPYTPRTSVNGMDFCHALVSAELDGTGWSDKRRVAFGLQLGAEGSAVNTNGIFVAPPLGATVSDANGTKLMTKLTGHIEAAATLGCRDRAHALGLSAKAASVAQDTTELAALIAKKHQALKDEAEWLAEAGRWRLGDQIVFSTLSGSRVLLQTAGLASIENIASPATVAWLFSEGSAVAEASAFITYSIVAVQMWQAAIDAEPLAKSRYAVTLDRLRGAELVRARSISHLNALEGKGIRP